MVRQSFLEERDSEEALGIGRARIGKGKKVGQAGGRNRRSQDTGVGNPCGRQ